MNKSRKYNVAIFDLDDTLVHSDFMNIKRFEEFFKKYNIKLKDVNMVKKQLYSFLMTFEDTFQEQLIVKNQVVDYFANQCSFISKYFLNKTEVFEDIMKSAIDISSMIKDADNVLDYLKQENYKLILLTNWFYDIQYKKLKKAGLDEYFDNVYGIDDSYLKPNIKAYKPIINEYNPNECIMIGDSYKCDVLGAKNTNMGSILINKKNDNENILKQADYVVKDLKDIKNIL